MAKIDHAAIRTASYEDAQKFFEDVFEMHMWREIGEKPERKCWYEEGIQLCEREEIDTEGENGYDHISIAVDSAIFSNAPETKRYPQEMYYRLLAAHLLPQDLKRILYLESK